MSPLLRQFILEARDILERMGGGLLAIEERPDDDELIDDLFRAVHTLKGNSGLFELPLLTRVLHAGEDVLDQVRDHKLAADSDLTDELLSTMDFVQRLLEDVESSGTIPSSHEAAVDALIMRLRARLVVPEAGEDEGIEDVVHVVPPSDWRWIDHIAEATRMSAFASLHAAGPTVVAIRYVPEADCFFRGQDPLLLLRNVPGMVGFSVRALEAWGPPAEIDIYRANLELQAISSATMAELVDHFRYVPEQVALYGMPVIALAVPSGGGDVNTDLHDDFVSVCRNRAKGGGVDDVLRAGDALLDMLNPDFWLASALRWLKMLVETDCAPGEIDCLLEAIIHRTRPAWQLLSGADPTEPSVAIDVSPTAQDTPAMPAAPTAVVMPIEAAGLGENAPMLDAAGQAMFRQILSTQRRLLDLPTPASQWEGRLTAMDNTLTGLFKAKADHRGLARLMMAVEAARSDKSFVPLAFFLDGEEEDVEDREVPAPPVPVAETSAGRQPNVFPTPAAEKDVVVGLPAQTGEDAADSRSDGATDKGGRVLKVSQEKIDHLMDLIGEMVVAKNALPYLAARAEEVFGSRELAREIKAQFSVINRIAEDMQDGIMQVRMLPAGAIFQRFPRLVRDVAKQLGKKVRLVLEGEQTEADKNIIEALGDPLIHILRNCLDHGLELPDVRLAAGKPEEGRLTVRAHQEGDKVLIEVEDDGKGIDPAVVKRKAFEKGLIDEQRLETISDLDAVQLVFAPGFSTADAISNLSGRGVGMDVVKTSVGKVGGQVSLSSIKGKGTKLVLTLPLSMAVSNVLMIDVGEQQFGVPLDIVVETVRVPGAEIHRIKDRRIAVLRGRVLPLYGADELLQLADPLRPNLEGEFAILVVRVGGETLGIVVDGFSHTTDVILKPLEAPLAGLCGFAGSALLGDGTVLLILDLKELVR
jgi:two-component system chemotaxis sensor kinase CheA